MSCSITADEILCAFSWFLAQSHSFGFWSYLGHQQKYFQSTLLLRVICLTQWSLTLHSGHFLATSDTSFCVVKQNCCILLSAFLILGVKAVTRVCYALSKARVLSTWENWWRVKCIFFNVWFAWLAGIIQPMPEMGKIVSGYGRSCCLLRKLALT